MDVRRRLRAVTPTLVWLGAAGLIATIAAQQGGPPARPSPEELKARFKKMSADNEARGLADPFTGVTTNGTIVPDLFPIRSTGVTTEPVRQAATAFLAALTPDQRTRTTYGVDDPEWRKWMNQHFYTRQGVGFDEMTDAQRDAAFGLIKASLSAKGLKLTRDVMRLNHTLAELNNDDFVQYGEWLYWITVMGTPSSREPWGWQLDGHHAIINYFVLGDQVVMTPTFFGSEPVVATSGKYKGTSILQDEQNQALTFVNALSDAQRAKAILTVSKTGNNNIGEAFKDNAVLDYAGLPAAELTAAQKAALADLVALYVGNMDDGHGRVKMDEVRRHLDRTYFAWIGETKPDSVFYYRIHSPVILVEFDHQTPVGIRHLFANAKLPVREHVHTVVRTPNGNDYGKDLLRQHYAAHRH